jgi:hypothetical protein
MASAQDPPPLFAVTHITNRSNAVSTLYFRVGDGPWQKRVIPIGERWTETTFLDGSSPSAPDLFVRVDADTNGVHWVEYRLSRGNSPDKFSPRWGHHFMIKQIQGTNDRFIESLTNGGSARLTDANSSPPF